MVRKTSSANSLLNSLKGKIWLATSALAFFISAFGMIAYLGVSFIINETFYAVFIPFLFLSFTVMIFGWWLSNQVVSPIEKVSLLAKSLERGAVISLPKTSGSTETDELLASLHRNNRQIQNLVGLMDKVAGGNLDVVLSPLENSDRLSSSFQKLLGKVTESINAKQDLEKLERAVRRITDEIGEVRNGNFTGRIESDFLQTKEINETFKFLLHKFSELGLQVKNDSAVARNTARETEKTIQDIIEKREADLQELNQAKLPFKQIPNSVQKIVEELSGSVNSANSSIEKARHGSGIAQQNLAAVRELRKQMQESLRRIGRLNERAQEIAKVGKTVGDLAHRTNMIALNASIQAGEVNEQGKRFAILEEEVERLAVRAENTNKQISLLNKTIAAEISEVERSLQTTVGEAANLSKFAIETGDALSELERYVGQFLNLQTKLVAFSKEKSDETEKAFQIFIKSIGETEKSLDKLKKTRGDVKKLSGSMESLQFAVEDYKFAEPGPPQENAAADDSLMEPADAFDLNMTP
ncbi:MAG: methyl-accepting chemotaxis protein [Pyrinomonadaceae bacterium]